MVNKQKKKNSKKVKVVFMPIRVPITYRKAIDELLEDGEYLNRSDFVRDAIRIHIERKRRSKDYEYHRIG